MTADIHNFGRWLYWKWGEACHAWSWSGDPHDEEICAAWRDAFNEFTRRFGFPDKGGGFSSREEIGSLGGISMRAVKEFMGPKDGYRATDPGDGETTISRPLEKLAAGIERASEYICGDDGDQ